MLQLLQIAWDTLIFVASFVHFAWSLPPRPISSLEWFGKDRLPLVHTYTLAMQLCLWDKPHYRAPSFAHDLKANLANVAGPGTGIPLSVFCYSKATYCVGVLLFNPLVSLVAAVYCAFSGSSGAGCVAEHYRRLLLFPTHWFALWRHNCVLAGFHALVSSSSSYALENKGAFCVEGQRLGLPVSPFYTDATVFVKHVGIEGGMGIHVFRNFVAGGEWVVQPALRNSPALSRLLPPGAPLSTLRVVTASTAWLEQMEAEQQQQQQLGGSRLASADGGSSCSSRPGARRSGGGGGGGGSVQAAGRVTPELPLSASVWQQDSSSNGNGAAAADAPEQQLYAGSVRVVTAVWRAGLAGKDTDHASICFPVDPASGVLSAGVSASHWYRLGVLRWLGRVDGSTAGRTWLEHPDSNVPVAGATIPDIQAILRSVQRAHALATPDVPLVGWDVALTPDGVRLLEVNLSCNLFNGHFDAATFYDSMYTQLDALGRRYTSSAGR